MSGLPVYIDIDGTLTAVGGPGGAPVLERIDRVKQMIKCGVKVVIWSASGTEYARAFADRHDLHPLAVIGKPSYCIDDNPNLRPTFLVMAPDELDKR